MHDIFSSYNNFEKLKGVYCLVGKNGDENRYDLMGLPIARENQDDAQNNRYKYSQNEDFSIIRNNTDLHRGYLYIDWVDDERVVKRSMDNLGGGDSKHRNTKKSRK